MGTAIPTAFKTTLKVLDAAEINQRLDSAIQEAIEAGQAQSRGILVTRHSPSTYTIELSPDVPQRVILERDLWAARRHP